jgi:fluoride ion exporter CrcB/FEX
MSFLEFIVLSVSSSIGAFLRYQLTLYFYDEKSTYQLGILIANLLGAYLIGLYVGYIQHISTISMEIVLLLQKGLLSQAILWLIAHVVGALCCTYLGILTQQSI